MPARHHASRGIPLFPCRTSTLLLALLVAQAAAQHPPKSRDVVVFGATPAGVMAAVALAEEGRSVVILEPSEHFGGMTTGGLGATDIGNKQAIGGLAREFYRRIARHYAQESAWRFQERASFRSGRQGPEDDTMWTFEPHVASRVLREFLEEKEIPVLLLQRLRSKDSVERSGSTIAAIHLTDGRRIEGRIFVDATYEGDLMARAGVSYHVGREAVSEYGESLNGNRPSLARHHQFDVAVDPWRIPNDPSSGLLFGIRSGGAGDEGAGDHRVQAFNFRMCLTDAMENRLPIVKPADYDASKYELLLRAFDAGFDKVPWHLVPMPNRKTDINNNHAVSTDFIGQNYEYPEADDARRATIVAQHRAWQHGLFWCLAHESRVPRHIREEVGRFGLCRDEFVDTGGWPSQLYVREARRMIGSTVMTQHHCQGRQRAEHSVGMAAYTMDSHHVRRFVDQDGRVQNEGDVQVGGFPPYPIDFGSIVPSASQCTNLIVPTCLSASHIAFGSIRMEPVFMVLGQSAGIIAHLALELGTSVQDVPYAALKTSLLAKGQVLELEHSEAEATTVLSTELPGVVLDDAAARFTGTWVNSRSVTPFIGSGYVHHPPTTEKASATFRLALPEPGSYEVRIAYTPHANRASRVPITIVGRDGYRHATCIDQRRSAEFAPTFVTLGTHPFDTTGTLVIDASDADGHVVVDAVQMLPSNAPVSPR